jgi:PEP-CTERM motif
MSKTIRNFAIAMSLSASAFVAQAATVIVGFTPSNTTYGSPCADGSCSTSSAEVANLSYGSGSNHTLTWTGSYPATASQPNSLAYTPAFSGVYGNYGPSFYDTEQDGLSFTLAASSGYTISNLQVTLAALTPNNYYDGIRSAPTVTLSYLGSTVTQNAGSSDAIISVGQSGTPYSTYDFGISGNAAGSGNVYWGVNQVQFDITSVSAVPEPGEWAMMLAGLGVVGAVARRRKAAR